MTRSEYDDADFESHLWGCKLPPLVELYRGGIVGAARLTGVVLPRSDGGPWHSPDQYGFRLASAMPLPFRSLRGQLGFFRVELTDDEERALRAGGLIEDPKKARLEDG
jgi:hypothetical protein